MSSVWVLWPSASPERHARAYEAWTDRGYLVGALIDSAFNGIEPAHSGVCLRVPKYQGYWRSVNELAKFAFWSSPSRVVVLAADDMLPDPRPADALEAQYLAKFPDGFGIMQPTGDDLDGTDRICGSPWIGRGWFERAYGGQGPTFGGYGHFYGDEELLEVSKREGVLWQRPDVTQRHEHWTRKGHAAKTPYQIENQKYWAADKRIFEERKAKGFPGAL